METLTAATLSLASFQGRAGAGPIAVPGVKAGDLVLVVTDIDDNCHLANFMECVATADDQIQQISEGNFAGVNLVAVIARSAPPASS